jgi:deazaflavin-dependent oxidoreductase (nitroreductase family)
VGDLVGVSDDADLDYCYLTTTGRVTGRPHEIEIWFALHDDTLFVLSGGGERSDWVRNLIRDPHVSVRIGDDVRETTARVVTDDDERELAGTLLVEKYRPRYSGDLTTWRQRSLPVAIAWDEPAAGGD